MERATSERDLMDLMCVMLACLLPAGCLPVLCMPTGFDKSPLMRSRVTCLQSASLVLAANRPTTLYPWLICGLQQCSRHVPERQACVPGRPILSLPALVSLCLAFGYAGHGYGG